jgi:hypothetical protein
MAGEPEDFILDLRFRKCTFFLVRKKKRGGAKEYGRYCGTAFAVAVGLGGSEIDKSDWIGGINYAVTAGHVVKNTPADEELFIRVNKVGLGTHDIKVPIASWKFHKVTDVAVCAVEWPEKIQLDVMTIPVTRLPQGPEGVYGNGVVEGEEITIVGLLDKFAGTESIQPIVRTGRIALMPYEKLRIEVARGVYESVDAYLMEMTSWPGLSGSPIIVYPHRNPSNPRSIDFMLPYLVIGLVHGTLELDKDIHFSGDVKTVKIGSGIALAIPGESIREVLMNNTELCIQRAELLERQREKEKPVATPDSIERPEEPPPFTQQDFEADLRKVSRKVTPSKSDSKTK